MEITKLVGSDENRYQSYTDYSQVSDWAKTNVKNVLAAHVFNGTTKINYTSTICTDVLRDLENCMKTDDKTLDEICILYKL
ncbi:hypothetical protein [Anaerotignum propionicum]|uniref:hypothetical protein n=1 Tax=Anaerotignum propionicum TaxID=28446 RepID=UPI00210E0EAF|nr:hypothetical protein [Anaerotignum propionicum]MCQ4935950.1 hypothetical protein [Anaerotignum propionicum]